MAIIKRNGAVWRVQIKRKGVRDSGTFRTEVEATKWAKKREAEILAGKTGKAPLGATLSELLDEYLEKVTAKKKDGRWDANIIKFVKRDPVALIKVSDIRPADLARWRDRRLNSVTAASVRRECTLLNHAFKTAIKEWRWLDDNPIEGYPTYRYRKRSNSSNIEIEDMVKNKTSEIDEGHGDDPRAALRRKRLHQLIEQHFYGRTSIFCRRTNKNTSLVSQYLNGNKAIGERFCGDVERSLQIPGWFAGVDAVPAPQAAPVGEANIDGLLPVVPTNFPCATSSEEAAMLRAFREMNATDRALLVLELTYKAAVSKVKAEEAQHLTIPKAKR
jgi:hypothetical protein